MVTGSPSTGAAREVRGREAALGDHGPRQIATNIQDGFSNRGEGESNFRFKGFRVLEETHMAMRLNFLKRHVRYTVIMRGQFWTSERRCCRGLGHGLLVDGWIRRYWTYWAQGRRWRRRKRKRIGKGKGVGIGGREGG